MVEKISVEIGLEGGEDVRKTLEEIVGGVDGLKTAAEDLGQTDVTLAVKAEGADEAKTGIDDLKTAAEELGQTDATVKVGVEGGDEAKASIDSVKGAAEELGQTDVAVKVNAEGAAEAKGLLDPISQSATIVSGSIDALGVAAQRMGARMTRSLGPLGVFARALGPLGIAVGVAAGALLKFGDSAADALNKLTVESAKLGLTAQQLDTLQQAFAKLGVAPDALASSLEKLKPLLGGGFMRVGDIVPPDVFAGIQQFIAQLESMPDGIARTKLAIDTLGEALGGQVIAGLQTGTNSAQIFREAIGSITPATQEQIVQAAKYQQALNQLSNAWTEFKTTVGVTLSTSVFEGLIEKIQQLKSEIKTVTDTWKAMVSAFQTSDTKASLDPLIEKLRQVVTYLNMIAAVAVTGIGKTIFGISDDQAKSLIATMIGVKGGAEQAGLALAGQFSRGEISLEQYTQKLKELQAEQSKTGQAVQQTGQAAQTAVPVFTRYGDVAQQAGQQGAAGINQINAPLEEAKQKIAELQQQLSKPATLSGIAPSIDFSAIIAAAQSAVTEISTLFQTAFSNLGASIGTVDFSSILTAAQEAVTQVSVLFQTAFSNLGESIGTVDFSSVLTAAQDVVTQVSVLFQTAWETITTGATTTATAITTAFSAISFTGLTSQIDDVVAAFQRMEAAANAAAAAAARVGGGGGGGGGAPKLARGGLLGGGGTGTSDSNLAWLSRGEYIMPAGAVAKPGVLAFLEALRRSGNLPRFADGGTVLGPDESIVFTHTGESKLFPIVDRILQLMVSLIREADNFAQQLNGLADTHIQNARSMIDQVIGIANSILNLGKNARGGLLGGRGTGTSDSNLAWVSRGEHIMPARAVRQPGVLAFLEALRRSGGNLRGLLDDMGHFARGGEVIPAFAAGGLNGGMSNVTIAFPGLPAIGGLRASSDVVDKLQRAAALAQVRSGGRKPSRYS